MKRDANNIAIQLSHITKQYTIHHEKPTLVEKMVKGREEKFLALHDVSLTIKKGEKVGIIGPNGSGKTTLLKIIAGITTLTKGTVETHGKIVSLIDLEAGFHPDLTGIQNIFLNGMLLGMRKQEVEKKMKAIIAFADIGQFIDTSLFTYSEGMKLRLGFSIAVHADPDILILDEGLVVGDKKFQKKSSHVLSRLIKSKKTLLIASHWIEFLELYSTRFIWLNKGLIVNDGNIRVLQFYKKLKTGNKYHEGDT